MPRQTTISVNGKQVTIAQAREILGCPGGECFGCFIGDAGPDVHDVPDACEYLNGFLYELGDF